MKIAKLIVNYLTAIPFLVLGANHFLHFLEMPTMEGPPAEFFKILVGSGFMDVVKIIEVICAIMLIVGFKKELAYVLLAPIAVNILLFDIFIAQQPGMGILLVLFLSFLFYANKERYLPIVAK